MLSVGRGIADITGEAADCGMLGYGKSDQRHRRHSPAT